MTVHSAVLLLYAGLYGTGSTRTQARRLLHTPKGRKLQQQIAFPGGSVDVGNFWPVTVDASNPSETTVQTPGADVQVDGGEITVETPAADVQVGGDGGSPSSPPPPSPSPSNISTPSNFTVSPSPSPVVQVDVVEQPSGTNIGVTAPGTSVDVGGA
jgi:hypothetical protein